MGMLLALVGLVVFQALQWSAAREPKPVPPGQEVTITVNAGEGSVEIGRNLRDAGVVDSVNRFRDAAEERGLDGALKPGTYKLVTGMSIDAVLEILAKGPSTGIPVTIPEGFTVAQIVEKLAATEQFTKDEVEQALESKDLIATYRPKGEDSLEGLLFPDTYGIEPDDTAVGVIQEMLDQLEVVLSRYQLSTAPEPHPLPAADRGQHDRAGGQGRRRPAQDRRRHLQPAGRREAAGDRRHRRVRGRPLEADRQGPRVPLALQHLHQRRAAPDPDRRPWRGRHQGRPPAGRRRLVYYVLATKEGEHAFTSSYQEFLKLKAKARAKGLL